MQALAASEQKLKMLSTLLSVIGLKPRISKLTSTFNRYFIRSILDFGEIQCYESGKKFLEQLEELM